MLKILLLFLKLNICVKLNMIAFQEANMQSQNMCLPSAICTD